VSCFVRNTKSCLSFHPLVNDVGRT
jgi:hypothetical protein